MGRSKTKLKLNDRRCVLRLPGGFGKERRALEIQRQLQNITLEKITLACSIEYVLRSLLSSLSAALSLAICIFFVTVDSTQPTIGAADCDVLCLSTDLNSVLLFLCARFAKLDRKLYVKMDKDPLKSKPFLRMSQWMGHLQLCKVSNRRNWF